MQHAPNDRKCHALLIYRRMIPSVRLCGHSQLEALAAQGLIEYRAVQDMRLSAGDMNWADVVFLGRLDNWYERRIAETLHRAGRRMVYIIDDDLLNIPPSISSADYYAQPEIQDNIRAIIGMCQGILSPSPLLLEKYARDGRTPLLTEEPALRAVGYRPHDAGAPVKIGFAGSIDRTADIEGILKDALLRVKRRYGDRVAFEFFGAVPAFAGELDAACVSYTETYDDYRRELNRLEWDIGLAPMPEAPFYACKHYNKFCEYAASAIAGIYTDCMPYTRIPGGGALARLCENSSGAWYAAICEEIEDAEGREARRRRCAAYAADELSPERIGRALFEGHPEIFAARGGARLTARHMALLKAGNVTHQISEKTRRHGWRLPLVAARKLLVKLGVLRS